VGLLDGRGALVTGGASGIGLATARRLAQEGARVGIVDVNGPAAEAAARELGALAWTADVTDLARLEAVSAEAAERLGGLRVLVANAGAGALSSLGRIAPEDFDRLLRVNLTGAYHTIRAGAPFLRAAGGGAIVTNASLSGVRATRGEAAYSAAKAGVIALTQGAALEWAPDIRVNCVSPGMIRTPLTELLFRAPGMLEPVTRATPLGRAGTADEVADAILFLCSDLSRFVTGQNLIVDGGLGLPQAGTDDVLRGLLARIER
jgi:NAD(P)-dependent dehydrogenase (short-subunit alcohol dehydrogenase family)